MSHDDAHPNGPSEGRTDENNMNEPETDSVARRPCPVCGEQIAVQARICRFCGERFTDASRPPASRGDGYSGMIPHRNQAALIAYYCGVFSVLPCFPIGLVALVLGIIGLRKAKREPEAKGGVHAWIGIIAGGLFGIGWLVLTGITVFAAAMGR